MRGSRMTPADVPLAVLMVLRVGVVIAVESE